MAALKIGTSEIAPITTPAVNTPRAVPEAVREQFSALRLKPYQAYALNREDAITYQETVAGTYEPVQGSDLVVHEQSSRKGQIVDLWV